MTQQEFLTRMKEACEVARQKGAKFNEAVVTAQAALESNWGNSQLAREANNLFGIKAGKSWDGDILELPTKEWSAERGWYETVARWRKYPSWNECIVDYAELIKRLPWFRGALKFVDDSDGFLRSILPAPGKPGWATDPKYKEKIIATAKAVEKLGGVKWA